MVEFPDDMSLDDAHELCGEMTESIRGLFGEEDLRTMQALCVAEEAGRFIGAYRRYVGLAGRSGTREEMEEGLADVILTALTGAHVLGVDVHAAVARKLGKVHSRGWQEEENRQEERESGGQEEEGQEEENRKEGENSGSWADPHDGPVQARMVPQPPWQWGHSRRLEFWRDLVDYEVEVEAWLKRWDRR